jgi:hypothetical protein
LVELVHVFRDDIWPFAGPNERRQPIGIHARTGGDDDEVDNRDDAEQRDQGIADAVGSMDDSVSAFTTRRASSHNPLV